MAQSPVIKDAKYIIPIDGDSLIKEVILHYREMSNHGAPCTLQVKFNPEAAKQFPNHKWRGHVQNEADLRSVVTMLNEVPDEYPKLGFEMNRYEKEPRSYSYPQGRTFEWGRGHHNYAGGDDRYIDSISPDNLYSVAMKFFRAAQETGLLSAEQSAQAQARLEQTVMPIKGVAFGAGDEAGKKWADELASPRGGKHLRR